MGDIDHGRISRILGSEVVGPVRIEHGQAGTPGNVQRGLNALAGSEPRNWQTGDTAWVLYQSVRIEEPVRRFWRVAGHRVVCAGPTAVAFGTHEGIFFVPPAEVFPDRESARAEADRRNAAGGLTDPSLDDDF